MSVEYVTWCLLNISVSVRRKRVLANLPISLKFFTAKLQIFALVRCLVIIRQSTQVAGRHSTEMNIIATLSNVKKFILSKGKKRDWEQLHYFYLQTGWALLQLSSNHVWELNRLVTNPSSAQSKLLSCCVSSLILLRLVYIKQNLSEIRRYHFWPQTTAFRLLAPIHSSVTCTVQVAYASFLIICRCKCHRERLSCCVNPVTCCKLLVPFLCISWTAGLKMSKQPLSPSCIYRLCLAARNWFSLMDI